MSILRYEFTNISKNSFTAKIYESQFPIIKYTNKSLKTNPDQYTHAMKAFIIGILADNFDRFHAKTQKPELKQIIEIISSDPVVWAESGFSSFETFFGSEEYTAAQNKLAEYGIKIKKQDRLCDVIIDKIEVLGIHDFDWDIESAEEDAEDKEPWNELRVFLSSGKWTKDLKPLKGDTALVPATIKSSLEKIELQFTDDNSDKFWTAELTGKTWTASWGKTGTAGQSKTYQFDSEEAAKKDYEKNITAKQKKGYTEKIIQTSKISGKKDKIKSTASSVFPKSEKPKPVKKEEEPVYKFLYSAAKTESYFIYVKDNCVEIDQINDKSQVSKSTTLSSHESVSEANSAAEKKIQQMQKKGYLENEEKENEFIKYTNLSFTPNGTLLIATSGKDCEAGIIAVYDGQKGNLINKIRDERFLKRPYFSKDGKTLFTYNLWGMTIWNINPDIPSFTKLKKLKPGREITSINFSRDEKYFIANENPKTAIWELHTKKKLLDDKDGSPYSTFTANDNSYIVAYYDSYSGEKRTCIRSVVDGSNLQALDFPSEKIILSSSRSLALSINSERSDNGDEIGRFNLYDAKSWKLLAEIALIPPLANEKIISSHKMLPVFFSSNEKYIYYLDNEFHKIHRFDIKSRKDTIIHNSRKEIFDFNISPCDEKLAISLQGRISIFSIPKR